MMIVSTRLDISDTSILVVDDTAANIGILRKILEEEGYKVLASRSGEFALQIASENQVDLILLDVMMPGIDGLETCRRLKAFEKTQDIPVIFVTALSDMEAIVEGFRIGGVDYIQKPFRHEEVRARIRTHLQIRKYVNLQRKDAERYRAIVNNMAEGLLLIDSAGVIRSANPAACNLLGRVESVLCGTALADLLAPSFKARYLDYFAARDGSRARIGDLGHGPNEVVMKGFNEEDISLDLTITEIFDDETLYVGLLHDISLHKKAHEEVLRMAHVDPLTGLANRRRFDEFIKQEWYRAHRSGEPISLALFDIDFFKQYNDNLGHQAGDLCLQQVAQAIKEQARRPTDLAARFGGEEFVLVFAGTGAGGASQLAEEARMRVESLCLPHPHSGVSPYVTVSVGIASIHVTPGLELEKLFSAADAALYRAKAQGKNRVETASSEAGNSL